MATDETEAELVELARHATAAHLDRMARGYRGVQRQMEPDDEATRADRRYFRYCWDDDGSLVIAGRLPADEGALLLQALQSAKDALATVGSRSGPGGDDPAGLRFPGCTQRRFVDGHHIQHWSQGGPTALDNLVLLCRAHHRLVHEGGFALRALGDGRFSFTRPDGQVIPDAPAAPVVDGDVMAANRAAGAAIGPDTGTCLWNGETLDLALALDALLCLEGRTFS